MKKVIILTGVSPFNGAGRVLLDVQKSLNMSGCQTQIISNSVGNKEDKNIIYLTSYIQSIFKRFKNKILSFIDIKKDSKYSMYDLDLSKRKLSYKKTVSKFPFKPDFIIYYFEHGFLTEKDLHHIGEVTSAPIFYYMADFGPLTGGCHYAWECEGYENQCGNCPGIYSNKADDLTHHNFMLKKKYIKKTNITPIVGSSWQYNKLLKSNLFAGKSKYNILAPINENLFIPIDKLSARKSLGLPIGKNIIYSGSTYVWEERKGYKQFAKALNYLYDNNTKEFNDNIHVIYSGNTSEDFISDVAYSNTVLPYVDYNDLYMLYNAVDIFASTSLQDAGPTMINQSMMCGTPVVSFKMGVALDLIDEGVTGYLADMLDFKTLANGIQSYFMLKDKEKKIMSENCRNIALSSSSLASFSSSFLKIFNNAS
jgi:glycosyltransferase involved in cell wall biosynthesis